ncbi:MAG: diguanylate cyclase [Pseudomonadota bacterium]|nr:diguanylate cyclase [Pseudomonadota bacterium]
MKELIAVFRIPFLRKVLLVALVAAMAFPLYAQFFSYPRFTDLLLRFTADDSERLALRLGAPLLVSGEPLSRESLPVAYDEVVRQFLRDFQLEKLKIFAPSGEVIYSTDPVDVGKVNERDYFHQQVAKGVPYSLVVRKAALTAEGQHAMADIVESYVPLMSEGRFVGAFEVYSNITTRQGSLDALLTQSSLIVFGMGGLLVLATLVTLVVAGRAQQAREAALVALRQSEARIHDMAASAQDAIIEMDANGRVSFWNQAAARIFGYGEAEAMGVDLHRLIAPQRFQAAFASGFQHFLATGEGRLLGNTTELVGLCKDGTEIPIEISISATQDHGNRKAIGIIRDIRERKAAEQRLKLGTSVITHAAQGITVTDADGNIQLVNPAFTKLTGFTLEEVAGQNPRCLKSGRHDADFYRELWRELLETGSWQGEIWNRRKSGEIYPEWLSLSAIYDDQGKTTNYIAMFSDISQLKEVEQGLERLAFYDPLTAIPNRILFRERLQQAMRETLRGGKAARTALLYLDLDHFKPVNDVHGHGVGDQLLQEVAARLTGLVREVDTVARLGGDEFAVVLSALPDTTIATRIADKIIAALTEPFNLGDGHDNIRIGTSIGIAFYPDHASELDALVKLADTAMYEAKTAGRNRAIVCAPRTYSGP